MEEIDRSVAVAPLPNPQAVAAVDVAGLLGADWLRDFDVDLDLPHRRVTLYHVEGCGGDYVPWPGPKTPVVAEVFRGGLVLIVVRLDGHPVTAMIDSGANHSILNETVAARIGIGPAELAHDPAGISVGVDGARETLHAHRFGQLRIGGVTYRDPVIAVAPLGLPVAQMLLGDDWLRGTRVWISYATHRVTIQAVPRGG